MPHLQYGVVERENGEISVDLVGGTDPQEAAYAQFRMDLITSSIQRNADLIKQVFGGARVYVTPDPRGFRLFVFKDEEGQSPSKPPQPGESQPMSRQARRRLERETNKRPPQRPL